MFSLSGSRVTSPGAMQARQGMKNCRESVNSIDPLIYAWLPFSRDHLHKSSCAMQLLMSSFKIKVLIGLSAVLFMHLPHVMSLKQRCTVGRQRIFTLLFTLFYFQRFLFLNLNFHRLMTVTVSISVDLLLHSVC